MSFSEEFRSSLNQAVLREYRDDANKKDLDLCVKKALKGIKQKIQPLIPSIQKIDVIPVDLVIHRHSAFEKSQWSARESRGLSG